MSRAPRRWAALAVGVVLVAVGARTLWLAAAAPRSTWAWDERTLAQLRFLSDTPETLDAHAEAMQGPFPEGRLFTLALTGLAWDALADRGTVLRSEANHHVYDALVLAEGPDTRRTFGPAGGLPHGMFYDAWTTHLLLAAPDPAAAWRDSLAVRCQRLDGALGGDALWVDSYPGQAWPADAVVGAAALHGCGRLDPAYAETARQWLGRVRKRLDPETGLIPHAAGASGARGSSTALMVPFLVTIDRRFALDQHRRFERQFGTRLLGVFPARREYPRGTVGQGDVDSGPVVLGVSAPASVVGIAAARSVGAEGQAQALRATVEGLGLPAEWRGERRYALARLPVGDAFLAWASSVPMGPVRKRPDGWQWLWAALSLGALAAGGLAVRYGWGGSSRARASISGQRPR